VEQSLDFSDWIGRREERTDSINANTLAAWNATLDRDDAFPIAGEPVPAGFHWTLFPPLTRQSELGADGHPRKGGFLPPIPLPRRMWAGGRLEFRQALRVGEQVNRVSTIERVETKTGRSGTLIFVTVRHQLSGANGLAIDEEQDLVYREASTGAAPAQVADPAPSGVWHRQLMPTEAQLFRYSALTFNAHRIHYDRPYAMAEEGYPGLVVHGPLIATLLLDLVRRSQPAATLERFSFRAMRPTYLISPFTINGSPAEQAGKIKLWSTDNQGQTGMEADASIGQP
jgi:3-methylfumaryl-CoA hydratase